MLGHVNKPGPVYFEKGATLISAVAAAGGPQTDAIVTKALILRGGTLRPQVAVVNLRNVMKGQEPDLKLEGGDIVWVPRSPWSKLEDYVEAVLITASRCRKASACSARRVPPASRSTRAGTEGVIGSPPRAHDEK